MILRYLGLSRVPAGDYTTKTLLLILCFQNILALGGSPTLVFLDSFGTTPKALMAMVHQIPR